MPKRLVQTKTKDIFPKRVACTSANPYPFAFYAEVMGYAIFRRRAYVPGQQLFANPEWDNHSGFFFVAAMIAEKNLRACR
jgi:hypothetical protein